MTYARKWTPPLINQRNNVAAWVTTATDIHDSLLLAGLVQTDDTGQLADFSSVVAVGANNTYSGYRVYRFNDALQATHPIFLKLNFGFGSEGGTSSAAYARSAVMRIRLDVYRSSNGDGTWSGPVATSYHPPIENLTITGTVTSSLTDSGTSFICYDSERGFLGFIYGAGGRNRPMAANNYQPGYQATLAFFIQRSFTTTGSSTSEGFSVIFPRTGVDGAASDTAATWTTQKFAWKPFVQRYINFVDATVFETNSSGYRPGEDATGPVDGLPQISSVYMLMPEIRAIPNLVSYRSADLSAEIEFKCETIQGQQKNFITLGNENCLWPSTESQYSSIAMLFE